jgi:hypothetical protein
MTQWRMRIACWILKTTNTHSDYVIIIYCPLQERMHESASLLSYTIIASLVSSALTRDAPVFKNGFFQTAMYRHFTVKEVAFAGSSIFRIVALLRLSESELCVEEYRETKRMRTVNMWT